MQADTKARKSVGNFLLARRKETRKTARLTVKRKDFGVQQGGVVKE